MNDLILGADPGNPLTLGLLVNGKPSHIFENERVGVQVQKPKRKSLSWETSPALLADCLQEIYLEHGRWPAVVIERVSMRPDQDMSSGQEFVGSMFKMQGVCAGLGVAYTMIAPSVWKPALGLKVTLKNPKEPARQEALRLWPDSAELFRRKLDHNRAEALLLAHYARGLK